MVGYTGVSRIISSKLKPTSLYFYKYNYLSPFIIMIMIYIYIYIKNYLKFKNVHTLQMNE